MIATDTSRKKKQHINKWTFRTFVDVLKWLESDSHNLHVSRHYARWIFLDSICAKFFFSFPGKALIKMALRKKVHKFMCSS